MKARFLSEDFLLECDAARELYHGHAEHLPIIDYHCHLPPVEIAEDKRWENITQVWLYGDHYKWRAMRTARVAERFCTGDASDWEKFERYAAIMPKTLRNPLYHWSHLELKRHFGVEDRLLGPDTAREIYDACNAEMRSPAFSTRGLLWRSRVEVVCTTDDPIDSLDSHLALKKEASFNTTVLPAWRPDRALGVDAPPSFKAWLALLEKASARKISGLKDFLLALENRRDFFATAGSSLSDHGMQVVDADECSFSDAAAIFDQVRGGAVLCADEVVRFRSFMLYELAVMDAAKGWTMQLHYGALRSVNSRMVAQVGPATGFDSIGDDASAAALGRHFDRLDRVGLLSRTIIYNSNPSANEVIASMIGNFQGGITPGKMQFGAAWWFLDQIDGVEDVCYRNARDYFGFVRKEATLL